MASYPKAPQAMDWQQEEEGGQDELSLDTAPSGESDSTRLAQSHAGGPAPCSPCLSIGFLIKQRSRRLRVSKCPAPTPNPVMTGRIAPLD